MNIIQLPNGIEAVATDQASGGFRRSIKGRGTHNGHVYCNPDPRDDRPRYGLLTGQRHIRKLLPNPEWGR